MSGEITNEFTNTTTTQCFDPRKRNWALPMLQAMDIPAHLFGPLTDSGTPIGTLLPRYQDEQYLNMHLLHWQPETIVNLREGIGFIPFRIPGSPELMAGNVESLRKRGKALAGYLINK